jgi:hypothetical protein
LSIDAEIVDVATEAYPHHLVKFGGSVDFPEWFVRTTLLGRWVGARVGSLDNNALVSGRDFLTERYSLDPYALVDIAVSTLGLHIFPKRETRVTGRVRNVFDTDYAFPGYGHIDIPGFERSFEIALRQEL